MTALRICLIAPPNYPHAACFAEVARLLWLAIRDNGYDCDFALNEPDRNRLNILIGYHLLPFSPPWTEVDTVVWQLEQLDLTAQQWNPQREAHLRQARAVWDFAPANIDFLAQRGIAAKLLIPGHHPAMQTIKSAPSRDVDILFYGSVGPRRRALLDELAQRFRVKALFGVYGAARDAWIARSHLVLNVHHYPAQIFEAVRISHLLSNRIAVVSEESAQLPWPDIGLCLAPYAKLSEVCAQLLADSDAQQTLRHTSHRLFCQLYPMNLLVRPLLKELA